MNTNKDNIIIVAREAVIANIKVTPCALFWLLAMQTPRSDYFP